MARDFIHAQYEKQIPSNTFAYFVGEALRRFRSYFSGLSDVVGQLDENPFPASFECEVTPRAIHSAALANQIAELRRLGGVEDVQFDWEWVRRLKRLVGIINIVGLI